MSQANTTSTTIIGVAGGSASGKSTLVRKLQEAFADEHVTTLCHDFYYKAHDDLSLEERSKLNYDHPHSFDTDMMIEHIRQLKQGQSIQRPVYSFTDHNRLPQTVCVQPAKVLILDGILILENKELRELMDVKVFVDTDDDVRLARRLVRDVQERGRDMNSVLKQYFSTVKPMHRDFVEPSKRYADIIIPEGGMNSVALSLLVENIHSLLSELPLPSYYLMISSLIGSDTICAVATAPGMGGIAIIRVSGSEAVGIVAQIFSCREVRTLERAKDRVAYFGRFSHEGKTIDEGLVTCFRAPRSYTGEDVVEISCHGAVFIQQALLEALTDQGCRMAAPGEFTRRAYLHGKMDLSRAEAVADLIASESEAQHRMALTQMRGGYSAEFAQLRERLLQLTSLMELELDFSEEDVTFADRTQLLELLDELTEKIERLTESFRLGNAIKRGVPVAIAGATNVGKSTLLNALLGEERAIVSDIHGTTRDTIEDVLNIDGVLFRFIDTAGLRSTDDTIEALGIDRSYDKIDKASLVLLLFDALRIADEDYRAALLQLLPRLENKPFLVLLNKVDAIDPQTTQAILPDLSSLLTEYLPSGEAPSILPVSAQRGDGLDELRAALIKALALPELKSTDLVVSNARHYELLTKALHSLRTVRTGLTDGLPTDLLTPDLRGAITAIGEVTGADITSDSVLHNIFAHFCIGK